MLGMGLKQHLAQLEQDLLWDLRALPCLLLSCGKGKGFILPPCSASRTNWVLLLLWVCRFAVDFPVSRDTPSPWEVGLSLAVSPVGLRGHR